jgi:hypothetical protein
MDFFCAGIFFSKMDLFQAKNEVDFQKNDLKIIMTSISKMVFSA